MVLGTEPRTWASLASPLRATLPDPLQMSSNIVNLKTADHSVLLGACADAIHFYVDIQTLHEPKDSGIEVNSELDILLMNKGGKVPFPHYMTTEKTILK